MILPRTDTPRPQDPHMLTSYEHERALREAADLKIRATRRRERWQYLRRWLSRAR